MSPPAQYHSAEDMRDSIEALFVAHGRGRPVIYWLLLIIVLSFLTALPLVKVDTSVGAPGQVRPAVERLAVFPAVSGRIDRLLVRDNQPVRKGDLLLELDASGLEARLRRSAFEIEDNRRALADLATLLAASGWPARLELYGKWGASLREGGGAAPPTLPPRPEPKLDHPTFLRQQALLISDLDALHLRLDESLRSLSRLRALHEKALLSDQRFEEQAYAAEGILREIGLTLQRTLSQWQSDSVERTLRATILAAEAEQLREEAARYRVVAPVDGTAIGFSGLHEGLFLPANQPLGEISPTARLQADVYLRPSDVGFVRVDQPVSLQVAAFNLTLENVSFRYPGRAATLRDVSLDFSSGTINALVGKSGCGKTTILGLLQRHYEIDAGRVRLAGVDLRQIKLATLREHIAFVPQKIDLLAGTVLENLAPNEVQPDLQRITQLCEEVGILEFIEGLPRGFQTIIHENGANLSGGQKQRLAVVRALYADAPIVLMDEPSSALDAASEEMLMVTLRRMRADGKLVILALHNQRLLSLCDHVVRLEEGQVVGRDEFAARPSSDALEEGGTRSAKLEMMPSAEHAPSRNEGRHAAAIWSDETAALHAALLEGSRDGLRLGQTDANVMGVREDGSGWLLEEGRCDLFEVTGRWPAVFGFDIGPLDGGWVHSCGHLVPRIQEAHALGGLILVSWHPGNLVTGGDLWTGCGVADLLPGAAAHAALRAPLDLIADNLGNLVDPTGRSIPVLFHCWHQFNADHFWWGRSRCTAREYQRLYRATVHYLRSHRRVRNVLFCWTPGAGEEPFDNSLDRYPGDDVVDLVGLDWFGSERAESTRRLLSRTAEAARFAQDRQKAFALTEVGFSRANGESGLAACDDPDWLRTGLFAPLLDHPSARRIAFLCFWRNEGYNPAIYHSPPPGSLHAPCLARLAEDPRLRFAEAPEPAAGVSAMPGSRRISV
jgi:ABC-type proline/glycine betaine transport system ATPase subunit/multidrug resistance efflux pump